MIFLFKPDDHMMSHFTLFSQPAEKKMSYKEKRELELKKEAEEKAAKAAAEVSFIRRNFISGWLG